MTLYNLEDKAELNPQNLAKLAKEADAGRVVIEYNGMWMLQDLANNLPENWIVYQCIATADGTTALTLSLIHISLPGLPIALSELLFQIIFQRRAGRRLPPAGDRDPCAALHPELARCQLGHRRQIDHIRAMKLDEALIRQKRLGHLCERHPDRQGRHILAAGEMEMHLSYCK